MEATKKIVSQILIVEDNSALRDTLFETLSINHQVKAVENGILALDYLKNTIPDLILLDIMLPFPIDGFSILRILKNDTRLSTIPVILMSALSSDEKITMGLEMGANDYIVKPFRIQEISLKIRNLVSIKNSIVNKMEKEMVLRMPLQHQEGFENIFKQRFESIVEKISEESSMTIHDIANEMSMSISTLERWVKKMYNVTPKKYILNHKLFKAEIMLRQQMGTVKDIAYLLGFNSVPYFCLCFRNFYGKSPKAYTQYKMNNTDIALSHAN